MHSKTSWLKKMNLAQVAQAHWQLSPAALVAAAIQGPRGDVKCRGCPGVSYWQVYWTLAARQVHCER